MADSKNYTWLYDLYDNAMTKDVKEDYVARVRTLHSMTVEDIARAIVAERTEFRLDTLINIANLIDEKIRHFVCQGNTVVTGTAQYSPSITGVFMGKSGTFDPNVQSLSVNITPVKALRDEIQKVSPEFSGYVKDLGGARIGLVKDTQTGRTDGTLTPGGIVEVTGSKIKSINADLPEGTYKLRVETYFSNSAVRLKSARTIDYDQNLVVGIAPSGGGQPTQPGGDGSDDGDEGSFG